MTFPSKHLLPWTEDAQTHECVCPQPYGHEQHVHGQRRTHSTAAWCTTWEECILQNESETNEALRSYTEASRISLWDEASTIFLTWKRFTALSYAHHPRTEKTYLTDTTVAVSASDGLHMTSSHLRTTMISTQPLLPVLHSTVKSSISFQRTDTYLRLKGMTNWMWQTQLRKPQKNSELALNPFLGTLLHLYPFFLLLYMWFILPIRTYTNKFNNNKKREKEKRIV